jgi:hypothetical protein
MSEQAGVAHRRHGRAPGKVYSARNVIKNHSLWGNQCFRVWGGEGQKSSDFREILGERVRGYPFFVQEREKMVSNDIKWCLLTPFWTRRADKSSKIVQTYTYIRHFFTYFRVFRNFCLFL